MPPQFHIVSNSGKQASLVNVHFLQCLILKNRLRNPIVARMTAKIPAGTVLNLESKIQIRVESCFHLKPTIYPKGMFPLGKDIIGCRCKRRNTTFHPNLTDSSGSHNWRQK